MKPYLILFLIGGVTGTFLDFLQTNAGQATYANPFLFQTAWWVPFLFGGATVAIGVSHCWGRDYGQWTMDNGPTARKKFLGSLCFLILACFAAAFLKINNAGKASLLLVLYLLSWRLFSRSSRDLLLAVGLALLGPIVENLLGHLGLYHYTHPDFFGIPFWLPFLYVHVSQAGGYLGRMFLVHSP